jgi:hypothetical protein
MTTSQTSGRWKGLRTAAATMIAAQGKSSSPAWKSRGWGTAGSPATEPTEPAGSVATPQNSRSRQCHHITVIMVDNVITHRHI